MSLTRRLVLAAAAGLALLTPAMARTVTMATEASFPPFSQTEADGSYTGFEIDLGNEVCRRAGLTCTWVKQDFDGAIAALLAKKFDVIFSSMSIKPEREQVADFSLPYYVSPTAFFGDPAAITAIPAGLEGKTVGVYGGSTQDDYMQSNHPDVALNRYENIDQMGADLRAGRIDAMLVEQLAGLNWLNTPEGQGFAQVGESISLEAFGERGAGAMFRKDDGDLRQAVNAALREIYADGTFQQIASRWFPAGSDLRADRFWPAQ